MGASFPARTRWQLLVALFCGGMALLPLTGQASEAATAPAIGQADCPIPDEIVTPGAALPHVRQALANKQLRILLLGSASGASVAASSSTPSPSAPTGASPSGAPAMGAAAHRVAAPSWPAGLRATLEAQVPGLRVEIDNLARRGSTTTDQLNALRRHLPRMKANLVVWQTGTVEAVQNTPPEDMASDIEEGIDLARASGADTVLMAPQFSRFLRANTRIDLYRDVLEVAASGDEVPLLRRYDLMHYWAKQGFLDLERTPPKEEMASLDRLHRCIGQALATLILRAAQTE